MLQTIAVEIDAHGGIGALKNSPCFNEDPVTIQLKMRDGWRSNSRAAS